VAIAQNTQRLTEETQANLIDNNNIKVEIRTLKLRGFEVGKQLKNEKTRKEKIAVTHWLRFLHVSYKTVYKIKGINVFV
jgi:hypothetical protein